MAEQNVPDGPEPRKPSLTFIKRSEHRRALNISRTREWQLLRNDPDHPKPVPGFGYVEHESIAYRELLITRRDAANGNGS